MVKLMRWGVVLSALAGIGQASCPGSNEVCDGRDNDLDGAVDEDFDADADGYPAAESCPLLNAAAVDCDDADASRNPAAIELVGDALDNDCDGQSDATRWVSRDGVSPEAGKPAHTALQAAVNAATGGEIVGIMPGAYTENVTIDGKTLTIAGRDGLDATVMDGGGAGSVITLARGAQVSLRGLTLTGGEAEEGAGLRVDASQLSLYDMALSGNTALDAGGGLALVGGAVVTVRGSRVEANAAFRGGGVFVGEGLLDAQGLGIVGNTAYALLSSAISTESDGGSSWVEVTTGFGGDGGGLYLGEGGEAVLSGVQIQGNVAVRGGGVFHEGRQLSISASALEDNQAWLAVSVRDGMGAPSPERETTYGGEGGGIYARAPLTLDTCTLTANQALTGGGINVEGVGLGLDGVDLEDNVGHGVYRELETSTGVLDIYEGEAGGLFAGAGTLVLGQSVRFVGGYSLLGGCLSASAASISMQGLSLLGCEADALSHADTRTGTQQRKGIGGGAFVLNTSLDLDALLVQDTRAYEVGGALYMLGGGAEHRIANATVVGAGAPSGGALRFESPSGTWRLTGLIVAFSVQGGGVSGSAPPGAFTYSDLYGNVGGDWAAGASPIGTQGNLSVDPRFVLRTPNGDPADDDLHLRSDSPCKDKADPASAMEADGTRADMGAYGGLFAALL